MPFHAHFRQDQMARKTGHLIRAERDAGGVGGKHGASEALSSSLLSQIPGPGCCIVQFDRQGLRWGLGCGPVFCAVGNPPGPKRFHPLSEARADQHQCGPQAELPICG